MELGEYLRGLRRHWLAVLAMTVLGFALAFGWAQIQTPIYEATASGLVKSTESANNGVLPVYDSIAMQKLPTYLEMAGWEEVAQGAIDTLELSITPQQVAQLVSVENPAATALIQVTARGSSAGDAAALAEAWISALTDSINRLEGGESGVAPVSIYLASSAAVPTTPVYPDVRAASIVGAVLGLGFGIGFALIRTASDRRVRVADDIERRLGQPIVGSIPAVGRGQSTSRLLPAAGGTVVRAASEAVRALRTNLQFMDVDNPPRTIVVTSSVPGDGKSLVACNLAMTLAAGGGPVVLVDGDLRRPVIAQTMGLVENVGLTDVLANRAQIHEVLQRAPGSPNLLVLGSGPTPPNPSEILGSGRMRAVLEDLAEHATVIIDAPPLLPVTDGAVLASRADGALLVVSIGKTTYDIVEKSVDTLKKAHGNLLGIVLNRVPLRGADASPYSRIYETAYAPSKKEEPTVQRTGTTFAEPFPRTAASSDDRPSAGGEPAAGDDSFVDAFHDLGFDESDDPRRSRRQRRG
ncbi:polysaccharide biosynthesis tyrosine autokinase [Microbacterium marinum]|uniref:polysaccharide biosynthesis tyrosine autokinase n=1 Tax=Microbacterium marinum TaxID=421115 RepID=UPI00384C8183